MREFLLQRAIYNYLVVPAGIAGAHVGARFNEKLRSSLEERRGWKERWREAGRCLGGRPVWFHVSSVGEFEQAGPVIAELSRCRPDVPVAMTFLSPSGFRYAGAREDVRRPGNIRFMEYLPLDTRRNAAFCLELLKPRVLVFVKFDLWPNLIWEGSRVGVPVVLIDATLCSSSLRLSAPGRSFYRAVYGRLDAILAISRVDAERFRNHCPDHPCIVVAGDTRFDRVAERARAPFAEKPFEGAGVTIIAGSTWPPDEDRILGALERILEEHPAVRTIIAPHEPSDGRVEGLLRRAALKGLPAVRWSERDSGKEARIIVVDRVGILAELYRTAEIAYVGGSFSTGVHSVIEPAVAGIPVLFGPRHENSREAMELVDRGGAVEIRDEESAYRAFERLVRDEAKRAAMGAEAKRYVESKLGATRMCVEKILEYL